MTSLCWRGIGPGLGWTCLLLLLCSIAFADTSVAASSAPGEASCANGREFALALANPAIATVVIEPEYFEVVNDDFAGLEQPVFITRHVAVVGHGARPPVVNLTYMSGKVGILSFRRVGNDKRDDQKSVRHVQITQSLPGGMLHAYNIEKWHT